MLPVFALAAPCGPLLVARPWPDATVATPTGGRLVEVSARRTSADARIEEGSGTGRGSRVAHTLPDPDVVGVDGRGALWAADRMRLVD